MARGRKALKVAAWSLGSIIGVIALAVAGVYIYLQTDAGRDFVRGKLEATLDDRFKGDVEVGKVTGRLLGEVTAHDVVIRDESGEVAVRAGEVSIDYDVRSLLDRTFHANELVVRGLEVNAKQDEQGELNLANLLEPSDEQGAPWTVVIDELRVEGSRLSLERAGQEDVTVSGVGLAGSVATGDGATNIELDRFAGRWEQRDLPITARGDVQMQGSALDASDIELTAGESRLQVAEASFDTETGALAATFDGAVTERDLQRFLPRTWRAAIELRGRVSREGGDQPLAVDLQGAIAGAPVTVTGRVDPARPSIDARVAFEQLHPRRVVATAPEGTLSGELELDVAGAALAALAGTIEADLRGQFAGVDASALHVNARIDDQIVRADLRANALHGTVRGELVANLRGEQWGVEGELTAESVRYQNTRVRHAAVDVDLSGIPADLRGAAVIRARGVRRGGNRLGELFARLRFEAGGDRIEGVVRAGDRSAPYWARARVVVLRQDSRTSIRTPELLIGTKALTWRGEARVTLGAGGRIHIERARLASAAGAVVASGRLRQGGRRGDVELAVENLQLARVRTALPEGVALPPLQGRVDLVAQARLGRWALEAEGRVDEFAWQPGMPPLTGTFDIDLGDGELQLVTCVTGPELGQVDVEVAVNTPRHVMQPNAWTPFRREWINRARVELHRVDLERVGALLPSPPDVEGVVSGSIEVTEGVDTFVADLRGRGLRGGQLQRPVNLDVVGDGSAQRIQAEIALALGNNPLLEVSGSVGAGVATLWRRPDALMTSPIEATVTLPATSVARLARLAGVEESLKGRIQASAQLRGTLERPRARFEALARTLGVDNLVFSEVQIDGQVDPQTWRFELDADQRQGGGVLLTASGRMDPNAPIEGELRAQDLQLSFLTPILERATDAVGAVGGRLNGRLALAGRLPEPEVRGWLRLTDGRARFRQGVRDLSDIRLMVRVEPDQFRIEGTADAGPGGVELAARGRLDGLMPDDFIGRIETEKLPFVAGGSKLALDVEAEVRGESQDELLELWVVAERGFLHLPKELKGRAYHNTRPLEDVIYVNDLRGPLPEQRAVAGGDRVIRVHLTTPNGMRVKGDGDLDARVTADLTVTRLSGRSSLVGTVETLSGSIELFEREYEILKANASFDGDTPPAPRLDVRLVHVFDRASVYVAIYGTTEQPRIELSSDPGIYSRAELLSFVLGGSPGEPGGEGGLAGGAASAASALIAGQVESLVQSRVPFDTVRIGTDAGDPDALAHVTVGKYLTEDLFVAYRRRFDAAVDENANEAQIEYKFLPQWVVEGRIGDRGIGSVDVLWIKRFGD